MHIPILKITFSALASLIFALSFALSIALTSPAFAQASIDAAVASCTELSEPELKPTLDLCSANLGCRLVINAYQSCPDSSRFLNHLKSFVARDDAAAKSGQAPDVSIFDRLKTLATNVGLAKKEVTANQVFEARLTDNMHGLESRDKDWQTLTIPIRAGIAKADKQELKGEANEGGGQSYTYIGDVRDGKANGWGTMYWTNGQITRGEFKNNVLSGRGEVVQPNSSRSVGTYANSQLQGYAVRLLSDGRIFKGDHVADASQGMGAIYRALGSMIAKGQYQNGTLWIGEVYDEQGNVTQTIDKPRDARLAREAAEQAFRDSLNAMTAPELYAKADELFASDRVKAGQMRQALQSRFPSHPLTIRLNDQIAQERAAAAEEARRLAELQRQQEILARQQAEQAQRLAAQQAERDRIAAEQARREKEARDLKAIQDATKLLEALTGVVQQRREAAGSASASSGAAAGSFGSTGGSGSDTSASCRGKGSCQFQMPTIAGCGTYEQVSYPGHYGMEQTNTCSYDVYYKLVIKKGPNFDSYGGHDEFPRLKTGQKFRGNGMFFKSETTKVLENFSCRTREDVSRMVGMKVAGGPDPNRKGCTYITPADDVGTSQ